MEFSNSDAHSTLVTERIAVLHEEADQNRLAQLGHQDGVRARLGRGLIALGQAIEGPRGEASSTHASNDAQTV